MNQTVGNWGFLFFSDSNILGMPASSTTFYAQLQTTNYVKQ